MFQRLGGGGKFQASDWRSKHSCSIVGVPFAWVKFPCESIEGWVHWWSDYDQISDHWTAQLCVIRLRSMHSIHFSWSPHERWLLQYVPSMHNSRWRLGLQAPLVAPNKQGYLSLKLVFLYNFYIIAWLPVEASLHFHWKHPEILSNLKT